MVRFRLPTSMSSVVSLAAADIDVGAPENWSPFIQWLDATLDGRSADALHTQQKWWASNGMTFRFLALPFEMRACIYGHVTGSYTWPHMIWDHRRADGGIAADSLPSMMLFHRGQQHNVATDLFWSYNRYMQVSYRDPDRNRPPLPTYLPRSCRQIAKEFWSFSMYHTKKHFAVPAIFAELTVLVRPQHLRRISLGFMNDGYFRFLGLASGNHQGFVDLLNGGAVRLLSSIPTLHHLHFQFETVQPRKNGRAWKSLDPWAYIDSNAGTDLVSCQKVFVDWFFTMALDHLRGIPRITFSGHVKNSTRKTWEQIFDSECKGYVFDTSSKIQHIQSTPWHSL